MRQVLRRNWTSRERILIVEREPAFFRTFFIIYNNNNFFIPIMINIFQFLKQGTSLNRKSHYSNQQLEQHIITQNRQKNHTYEQAGKFHDSDSEMENDPETLDEQELLHFKKRDQQKALQFARHHKIKVVGLDYPYALNNFTKMIHKYKLKQELIKGLGEVGYERPTPVQMQVIPCLLEKRNVIVTAPTGTGKTLAFLLPILNNLQPSKKITAVIMVPVQQLATQILQVLSKVGVFSNLRFQCCSKLSEQQLAKIEGKKSPGYNIIVATPLNFLKVFKERKILLKQVEYIVLDQCDKCFQQSFYQQVKEFLGLFSKLNPTYALFSATIQNAVQQILKTELDDCVRIEVGGKNKVLDKIEQSLEYCTNQLGKLVYLKNLIIQGKLVPPVLLFVQEKQRAKQLYYELKHFMKQELQEGRRIEFLSSDKSKDDRQKIISQFDQGKFWILITTDILARGIDFKNANLVINYDFPNSMLTYIHRVGRTGRAERTGQAVTFFTDQDKPLLRSLANLLNTSGCPTPQWISQMPKANKKLIKKLEKYPVRRLPVGKAGGKDKEWQKQLQVLQKRWNKLKQTEEQKAQKRKKKVAADEGWIQVNPDN